ADTQLGEYAARPYAGLKESSERSSRRRHVTPLDGTWPTFAQRSIVCSSMRLLVIAASALAVAASATAGNNQIAAWCTGSQLRIAVQSAGENTTAWIGVLIRNRQRECDL